MSGSQTAGTSSRMHDEISGQPEGANAGKEYKFSCSYCGKKNEDRKLSKCSRCRSVRYCDSSCQLAHFRASHKADCENFAHPPITSRLDTRSRPIFAKTSRDGVGCWITAGIRDDQLLQTMHCGTPAVPDTRYMLGDPKNSSLFVETKGDLRNLLTLHVLVQNRRKDRAQVLIFSYLSMAIGNGTDALRLFPGWQAPDDERVLEVHVGTQTETGKKLIMPFLRPFADPWGETRASVISVNGSDYHGNLTIPRGATTPLTHPHNKIKSPEMGLVALGYGDYAVLELQYRCADGDTVRHDLDALSCLRCLWIPWMPWDGHTDTGDLFECVMRNRPSVSGHYPNKLLLVFEMATITRHYGDFMLGRPSTPWAEETGYDPVQKEMVDKALKILDRDELEKMTRLLTPMGLDKLFELQISE